MVHCNALCLLLPDDDDDFERLWCVCAVYSQFQSHRTHSISSRYVPASRSTIILLALFSSPIYLTIPPLTFVQIFPSLFHCGTFYQFILNRLNLFSCWFSAVICKYSFGLDLDLWMEWVISNYGPLQLHIAKALIGDRRKSKIRWHIFEILHQSSALALSNSQLLKVLID